mgnify:CR=1 FL=1
MAREKEAKKERESVEKPIDPFLYIAVQCRWREANTRPLLGVKAFRPTLPDHIARKLEEIEKQLLKELNRQRPSVLQAQAIQYAQSKEDAAPEDADGVETVSSEETQKIIVTQRRQWLEQALSDNGLDADARQILCDALSEPSVPESLRRMVGRSTNTFPRNQFGNFVVPSVWFQGGIKAALESDGLWKATAQQLTKKCIFVYPAELDLGTKAPDITKEVNMPLPDSRSGGESAIKLSHGVIPGRHGKVEFTLLIKVVDSAYVRRTLELKPKDPKIADRIYRILILVGEAGIGGGRPDFGKFDVKKFTWLDQQEGRVLAESMI